MMPGRADGFGNDTARQGMPRSIPHDGRVWKIHDGEG